MPVPDVASTSNLAAWTNFATVVGAPIAFAALIVGVATLLSSARAARLQYMHNLFKEYLRLEFEYNTVVGTGNQNKQKLRSNLGGFKMYSLEEMLLWLQRERAWNLIYFWSQTHRSHINSWQSTIEWHLDQSSEQDFAQFETAIRCYGKDFIAAVRQSQHRISVKAKGEANVAPST